MTHQVSPKGIVGLGALGRALELFMPEILPPGAVIFAVKAFDLEAALLEHASRWPENIPFVTMCNGFIWPIIERLENKLGKRPIRIGMTTLGSTIKPDGSLKIFADGTTTAWGHWPKTNGEALVKPSKVELDILGHFPGGEWFNDIRPIIRRKWILNVVINSIVGAYRLPKNGLLVNHKQEIEAALAEAINLADKLWPGLNWEAEEKHNFQAKIWNVVNATAENENSMVRDLRLGRRTESDYLAGIASNFDGFSYLKNLHLKILGNH